MQLRRLTHTLFEHSWEIRFVLILLALIATVIGVGLEHDPGGS